MYNLDFENVVTVAVLGVPNIFCMQNLSSKLLIPHLFISVQHVNRRLSKTPITCIVSHVPPKLTSVQNVERGLTLWQSKFAFRS